MGGDIVTANLHSSLLEAITARKTRAEAATPGPWWHNPGKLWLRSEAFEQYDRSKGEKFVGYGGPSPFTGCIAATGPADDVQSMADATLIAAEDPAAVLRQCERDLKLLARHRPLLDHPKGVCAWDREFRWPCVEIRDLADAYVVSLDS